MLEKNEVKGVFKALDAKYDFFADYPTVESAFQAVREAVEDILGESLDDETEETALRECFDNELDYFVRRHEQIGFSCGIKDELEARGIPVQVEDILDTAFANSGIEQHVQAFLDIAKTKGHDSALSFLERVTNPDDGYFYDYSVEEIIASWKRLGFIKSESKTPSSVLLTLIKERLDALEAVIGLGALEIAVKGFRDERVEMNFSLKDWKDLEADYYEARKIVEACEDLDVDGDEGVPLMATLNRLRRYYELLRAIDGNKEHYILNF